MGKEKSTQTFNYYCEHWLNAKSVGLKASSYVKYRTEVENHIKPFWGNLFPEEVTAEEMNRFYRMLLEDKKLSPKTVRSILTLFRTIFSYIEKRCGQELAGLEIIYPKEPRKTIRILDEREEAALIRFLAEEMDLCKFGIYMALRTGMRIGEICALRWCDISFCAYTISIRHTVQRIGFTDSGTCTRTRLVIGTPKSESSLRTIPLMPDVDALCRKFYSGKQEAFILTGIDRCMEPRKLQRRLKTYTDLCRLDRVHFHTLRHTFATRCIEAGFDIKTLSRILGHASVNITLDQYVHPNIELMRENMRRLKTAIPFSDEAPF